MFSNPPKIGIPRVRTFHPSGTLSPTPPNATNTSSSAPGAGLALRRSTSVLPNTAPTLPPWNCSECEAIAPRERVERSHLLRRSHPSGDAQGARISARVSAAEPETRRRHRPHSQPGVLGVPRAPEKVHLGRRSTPTDRAGRRGSSPPPRCPRRARRRSSRGACGIEVNRAIERPRSVTWIVSPASTRRKYSLALCVARGCRYWP